MGGILFQSYYFSDTMTLIKEGDEIYLVLDARRTYKVKIEKDKQFHTHKGFIELEDLIGQSYGINVTSSLGVSFYVLKPLIRDRVLKTDRLTQVLYPKDIFLESLLFLGADAPFYIVFVVFYLPGRGSGRRLSPHNRCQPPSLQGEAGSRRRLNFPTVLRRHTPLWAGQSTPRHHLR